MNRNIRELYLYILRDKFKVMTYTSTDKYILNIGEQSKIYTGQTIDAATGMIL